MKPAGSVKLALILAIAILTGLLTQTAVVTADEGFTPEDIMRTKLCGSARISPDGRNVAYILYTPREPADKAGGNYATLHVVNVETGKSRTYIGGKVNISSPSWRPDGSAIAFLMSRGEKAKTQVWLIPFDGGEAAQITHSKSSVLSYQWHPDGSKIAYVATTPETDREKELEKKGYNFIYFHENLKHRNLYITDVNTEEKTGARQLTDDITVYSHRFSPDGGTIAIGAAAKNLIDYRYMFQKIHLVDVQSGARRQLTDNPGKLGNFAFSPDGFKLAYAAAKVREDHAVSQAYVIDTAGGETTNLTPPKFRGHVNWVTWKDKKTVCFRSAEEVWQVLSTVPAKGGDRKIIQRSDDKNCGGVILYAPSHTKDFKHFATSGHAPDRPRDIYYWQAGKKIKRLTDINPWLKDKKLGKQEVIWYTSSDSLNTEIQGILIYPVDYQPGKKYPLIVHVHGGPESNYSNGWMSRYFDPAQVLAAEGYFFFAPNYRPSTGYGLDFVLPYLGDPAGREFIDVADGIDHLVAEGLVDPERVGLGGGSYGGFAAAWFAGFYTEKVKAVCMFVGISDLISKRGTTDIPYEELYVHSEKKLEDMWQLSLERSPLYHAHKSKTAVLIVGGAADSRVHPSQSLEFYNRLTMNDHPAVRLVQYPGEGHGNRKQPGQIDLLHRHLQWYNWYVKDKKPLDGPMPPLDISDTYGLDLKDDKSSTSPPEATK